MSDVGGCVWCGGLYGFHVATCRMYQEKPVAEMKDAGDLVALVAEVKARLEARGFDLSGSCGAFSITQRVAWLLRENGAGLLDKPSGNNCLGFSTDVIAFQDGRIVDILIDGGGANVPTWRESAPGEVDPFRWRPPSDPGDTPSDDPADPAPIDEGPIALMLREITQQLADQAEKIAKIDGEVSEVRQQFALAVHAVRGLVLSGKQVAAGRLLKLKPVKP